MSHIKLFFVKMKTFNLEGAISENDTTFTFRVCFNVSMIHQILMNTI